MEDAPDQTSVLAVEDIVAQHATNVSCLIILTIIYSFLK